jgi:hypothetical protein
MVLLRHKVLCCASVPTTLNGSQKTTEAGLPSSDRPLHAPFKPPILLPMVSTCTGCFAQQSYGNSGSGFSD